MKALGIILFSLFGMISMAKALTIRALVPQDVLVSYHEYLGKKDPLKIESFTGEKSRRDVVELILFQQALSLGGWGGKVEFIGSPSYSRSFMELKRGSSSAIATTVWKYDVLEDKELWASASTVGPGDFMAGFYGLEQNIGKFKKLKLKEIKKLKVVTSKVWKSDYEALDSAGFENILDSLQWELMIRMVAFGRADLVLSPFRPSEDLGFTNQGVRLRPIPGYKINLPGERVWVFNKNTSDSARVIKAFEKGMKELVAKGLIKKAYRESGFFSDHVKDWVVVK